MAQYLPVLALLILAILFAALSFVERDQRRADANPVHIARVLCDGRLQSRDHHIALEHGADAVQRFLLGVRIGLLPGLCQRCNRAGIDVGGGTDASGATGAQGRE